MSRSRPYVRQSATLQEGLDCYTDRSAGPTGRRFQPPLASVRSTGTGLRKEVEHGAESIDRRGQFRISRAAFRPFEVDDATFQNHLA